MRPPLLAALMLVAIWTCGALLAWRDRVVSLDEGRLLSEALTRAASERALAGLRGVDLLLSDVAARSLDGGDPGHLATYMHDRGAAFAEVRTTFILGPDGKVKASTRAAMEGMDLSARPYFAAAAASPHRSGLIVAAPAISVVTGKPGLVVAQPIIGPLGTFAGVAAAALDPEFFGNILRGAAAGPANRAVIANIDGDVLARLPEIGDLMGRSIKDGALFRDHLPRAAAGTFTALSSIDGAERLAAYRTLEPYPVIVSVGMTTEAALARWRINALMGAAGGLALSAAVMIASLIAERRLRQRRETEEALRTSEESYRILVDAQDDLICRFTPDTCLISFNLAFAKSLGRDPEEIVGARWLDLLSDQDATLLRDRLRRLSRSQPRGQDVRRRQQADGSEVWTEWRTQALYDARLNLVGYLSVGRDVTDAHRAQKAIAEREELYSQSFHRNPAIKLLVDPRDGSIVDANDSAAEFYGYPLPILKTMRISEINTAAPEDIQAEMRAVEREGRRFLRFRHRLASGSVRDVEVYSSPLQVGGRRYLSSFVVDVSDRNRFEAELQAKSEELARSNAELEQFAYVASHDLRQPLRMIGSYVTLLERRLGDALDDDSREFVRYAVNGVRRMDALIKGLLEYSRVGRSGTSGPVDLAHAVESARANLGLDNDNPDARLTVEGEMPVVIGVEGELVRLFQNLIGNAVKYRRPGRRAEISVSARRDGAEWIITVADDGIGIAPEHADRIFMMFQRLHTEAEYEGTGIGLAVCRKIVEHHKGRIWVESEEGLGCRFMVTLPVRAP